MSLSSLYNPISKFRSRSLTPSSPIPNNETDEIKQTYNFTSDEKIDAENRLYRLAFERDTWFFPKECKFVEIIKKWHEENYNLNELEIERQPLFHFIVTRMNIDFDIDFIHILINAGLDIKQTHEGKTILENKNYLFGQMMM